jgi:indolepyruvate ferredoxin oxidoreductase
MAAHLQGLGASVLDFTGFAQKFGPVLSYLRLAPRPEALNQVRIDLGAADALIGCDLVVSTSPKASTTYRRGTRAVVNTAAMPTGDLVRHRDADLAVPRRLRTLRSVLGEGNLAAVDANELAERHLGDAIYANMIMLGMAWQAGLLPLSHAALMRAIELNGVEADRNRLAFALGRLASADPAALQPAAPAAENLDELIARRADFLAEYQDARWAGRYRAVVDRIRAADPSGDLAEAVARSLFKLMSYKDEYEVARLHTEAGFEAKLRESFEGDFRITHHLAPDFLPSGKDARGRSRKRRFGPWVRRPLSVLAKLRRLRGTPLDPFGYAADRRRERALIAWYEEVVEDLLRLLPRHGTAPLIGIAAAPLDIRGFGPVKAAAAEEVQSRVAARLAELRHQPQRPLEPAASARAA